MDLSSNTKPNKNSWLIPWLVLAICVLPIIASTALYYFWEPDGFVNHGELIEPVPVYALEVRSSQGDIFSFADLNGFWSFVSIDALGCKDICEKKLYLMRQIRLTQGAEKNRLQRLHFVLGDSQLPKKITDKYEGTQFISVPDANDLSVFGDPVEATNYIYLVDQIGNLMMRFPVNIDPSLMKKDVGKLLKISKAWKKIN
ncbi:MAG: hypothetical protein O3B03_01700 [Proteobacteria bacterium]|nr:hypothetical protein [Pseudomonadota bacterium]